MSTIDAPPVAPAPHTAADPPEPAVVARRFLEALTARDAGAIGTLLAPNLWMRALLPRRLTETHTAAEAVAAFDGWFGPPERSRVVEVAHHTVHGREHVRYRLLVRPEWDPGTWHDIEQAGYLRAVDGVVTRLDLVCTGFWPVQEPLAA